MSITQEEKENILLHAKEEARALIKEVLIEHIQSCPIGMSLRKYFFIILGICFCANFLGSATFDGLLKLLHLRP